MKVSGFTFVRNAIKYGYPVKEAIESILPICDEVVVCLGNSEDDTLGLIQSIQSDKIRIIHSVWDDSLRAGGQVLAIETNKAFDAVSPDSDWAFYIQGDEAVHEDYLPEIKKAMERWKNDEQVEGLLFNYRHFYGSYDYVGDSRRWYRKEIRVIKNDKSIRSFRDAQGFRKNGRKLQVKPIDAYINHYGWVKHPDEMKRKEKNLHQYWHSDEWIKENVKQEDSFDYSEIDSLVRFTGTHPKVMQQRINQMNWDLGHIDISKKKFTFKEKVLFLVEKLTGYRPFEYKNYTVL